MSRPLLAQTWSLDRLGDGLAALAAELGLARADRAQPGAGAPADATHDAAARARFVAALVARCGFEAAKVRTNLADLVPTLHRLGPALVELPGSAGVCYLLVLGATPRGLRVLTPGSAPESISDSAIREGLTAELSAATAPAFVAWMGRHSGDEAARLERALHATLAREQGVEALTLLTPVPQPGLLAFLREARVLGLVASGILAQGAMLGAYLLTWLVLGQAFLGARVEASWLVAFGMALLTLLALRIGLAFVYGELSLRLGATLRARLFRGATNIDPQLTKHEGSGLLLGRVLEVDALEASLPLGALQALGATLEAAASAVVLGLGPGGTSQVFAFLLLVATVVGLAWLCLRRRGELQRARVALTGDLVESMVGHRTRLVQERQDRRHAGEDEALAGTIALSRRLDQALALLRATPRLWLPCFVLGLGPAFIGGRPDPGALALAVAGALLGARSLRSLAEGLERLGSAKVAAGRLLPLWRAADAREPCGRPELSSVFALPTPGSTLITASQVTVHYEERSEPTLRGLDLAIQEGQRLLLVGSSGGGKSTLARVLAGTQPVSAGLVQLAGYDRATLGASAWRRGVVLVPQFHEDHLMLGSLAFNLLLGCGDRDGEDDLARAGEICSELGLGELLMRMPSGLHQLVGETGWQLSHGERARFCLARALVQRPAVLILDESFGALDPGTLEKVLRTVLARQATVLAIAHV